MLKLQLVLFSSSESLGGGISSTKMRYHCTPATHLPQRWRTRKVLWGDKWPACEPDYASWRLAVQTLVPRKIWTVWRKNLIGSARSATFTAWSQEHFPDGENVVTQYWQFLRASVISFGASKSSISPLRPLALKCPICLPIIGLKQFVWQCIMLKPDRRCAPTSSKTLPQYQVLLSVWNLYIFQKAKNEINVWNWDDFHSDAITDTLITCWRHNRPISTQWHAISSYNHLHVTMPHKVKPHDPGVRFVDEARGAVHAFVMWPTTS